MSGMPILMLDVYILMLSPSKLHRFFINCTPIWMEKDIPTVHGSLSYR